jgi:predicted nucleic acid-binding protein
VDTNILLAASDPSRPRHREAFEILQRWPGLEATLFASGQVLREYLAVATRPLQANGLGLTRAEALDNVHQLLRRLHLLDEDGRSREELLTLVRDIEVAGKQIHDANIVATMIAGGVEALPASFTSSLADSSSANVSTSASKACCSCSWVLMGISAKGGVRVAEGRGAGRGR